jgi:hypothetical protein
MPVERTMPYYISYMLLAGSGTRIAETAADAVIACHAIRGIGGGGFAIKDHNGTPCTVEQLGLVAFPKIRRERDPTLGPAAIADHTYRRGVEPVPRSRVILGRRAASASWSAV